MPTTQELVTLIQSEFAQDVSRSRILSYIDRAQKELFNNNLAQNIFFNRSDVEFPWPILQTVAGTLSYEITSGNFKNSAGGAVTFAITDTSGVSRSVNIRKVIHVFQMISAVNETAYNRKFYGERVNLSGINYYWSKQLQSLSFYTIPLAENIEKTNLQNARITFAEDPGTTTDQLFVEMIYAPVDLVSEAIPMTIDANRWQEAVIDAVSGYIEQWRNGRTDKLLEFRKYWMPKFKSAMNEGYEQRKPLQMSARECG